MNKLNEIGTLKAFPKYTVIVIKLQKSKFIHKNCF